MMQEHLLLMVQIGHQQGQKQTMLLIGMLISHLLLTGVHLLILEMSFRKLTKGVIGLMEITWDLPSRMMELLTQT